jgi:hypothetical protein
MYYDTKIAKTSTKPGTSQKKLKNGDQNFHKKKLR